MCVLVGVEYVGYGELAQCQHEPIRHLRAAQLVGSSVDLLASTAEVDCIAHEIARDAGIRDRLSEFIGFPARVSGDAERIAQSETLIDFRVDPQLRSLPEPHPEVERNVPGLTLLSGDEAVRTNIGRAKVWIHLDQVGGLGVHAPIGGAWGYELRSHRRAVVSCAGKTIIEAHAHVLERESGVERLLRSGEGHALGAEVCEKILKVRGPVAADHGLDARAGDPAAAKRTARVLGSGSLLRARDLILRQCVSGGAVNEYRARMRTQVGRAACPRTALAARS